MTGSPAGRFPTARLNSVIDSAYLGATLNSLEREFRPPLIAFVFVLVDRRSFVISNGGWASAHDVRACGRTTDPEAKREINFRHRQQVALLTGRAMWKIHVVPFRVVTVLLRRLAAELFGYAGDNAPRGQVVCSILLAGLEPATTGL